MMHARLQSLVSLSWTTVAAFVVDIFYSKKLMAIIIIGTGNSHLPGSHSSIISEIVLALPSSFLIIMETC